MTYAEVIAYSESITKQFGLNYYRATKLFPREIREVVFLYYAWIRIPDEYVDSGFPRDTSRTLLEQWIQDWKQTEEGVRNEYDIHWFMNQAFERYQTPRSYADDFFAAMTQDLEMVRYERYSDLEKYMHGSAVVVGYTMLSFFGLLTDERLPSARAFAEAMQLTNFLRDIREDYEKLGRIYLPQEDMRRFGVMEEDIKNKTNRKSFQNLIDFEVARCRDLYKVAWQGIESLPWRIKIPLRIAARKYEGILDEIERANYDIWSKRHTLPKSKKLFITFKSLFT